MNLLGSKPSVLFLVQCFETRAYLDSAGYCEVVAPMQASGLLGEVAVHTWGKGLELSHQHIAKRISSIFSRIANEAVVVYGAGAHSEEFIQELSQLKVVAFSDTNRALWGQTFLGLPVVPPGRIGEYAEHVVVSSRVWDREITNQLTENYPALSVYSLYKHFLEQNDIYLQAQIDVVRERYRSEQFDLIFYCPASPAEAFSQTHFEQLRNHFKAKMATIWWDYDNSSVNNEFMQFERCSLAWSDIIVDPGNYTKTACLKSLQPPYHLHAEVEKVHVLPTSFNPKTFFPRPKDWSLPVAMFGSVVGARRQWHNFLETSYSGQYRQVGGVNQGREVLPVAEYARLVAMTPVIVNTQTYEFRSQCKGKVREVLACAGLLLEQDNPESRAFFDDQDFILFFSGNEQLKSLIDYYLLHHEEAEERALEAHRWYLENWSAHSWTRKLLQLLEL